MPCTYIRIATAALTRSCFFLRVATNQFVQGGARITGFSQNSTESLFGLFGRSHSANDDRHLDLGQIDPLIEHLVTYQCRVRTVLESVEHLESLFFAAMAKQTRDQETR